LASQFPDEGGYVPVFEPKILIGRDLEPGGEGKFHIQDYAS
jgi:hypothetical protein